mgnify:CR=1 FL=1
MLSYLHLSSLHSTPSSQTTVRSRRHPPRVPFCNPHRAALFVHIPALDAHFTAPASVLLGKAALTHHDHPKPPAVPGKKRTTRHLPPTTTTTTRPWTEQCAETSRFPAQTSAHTSPLHASKTQVQVVAVQTPQLITTARYPCRSEERKTPRIRGQAQFRGQGTIRGVTFAACTGGFSRRVLGAAWIRSAWCGSDSSQAWG